MAGKIQGADLKTEAELISAGGTAADLPKDSQLYVTSSGINKTLDDALTDNDITKKAYVDRNGGIEATVTTSGGTTVLTSSSGRFSNFTGTLNQTVEFPAFASMVPGATFTIQNSSSGVLTVTNSVTDGGATIATIPPTQMLFFRLNSAGIAWVFSRFTVLLNDAAGITATGGTTTLLANAAKFRNVSTGAPATLGQTIVLPDTAAVRVGEIYVIQNNISGATPGTGLVTVQNSLLSTIATLSPGHSGFFRCSPTANTWFTAIFPHLTGSRVKNLANPVDLADAATKSYVDTSGGGITATTTSGGTLTLTSSSLAVHQLQGSSTHTVVLPDVGTLPIGKLFTIINRSTGAITIQDFTTATIATLQTNQVIELRSTSTPQQWFQFISPLFNSGNTALTAGSKKIESLADPTSNQDAATKIYVDNKILTYEGTSAGGSDTETLTFTGLLATDTILSVSQRVGTNNVSLRGWSSQANDSLQVQWSGNPGAGSVVRIAVKR